MLEIGDDEGGRAQISFWLQFVRVLRVVRDKQFLTPIRPFAWSAITD